MLKIVAPLKWRSDADEEEESDQTEEADDAASGEGPAEEISHDNVIALSRMSPQEVKKFGRGQEIWKTDEGYTPVWCMIFDHLSYEHEAHIFAEQQKHHRLVSPYDTFYAHLESGSEKHLLIRDLVYSYNLELGSTQKRHGVICAIAALENIFDTYGYHVLDKVLRILVSTWEGEIYSLTGNMLNAVARMLAAYGDALNEETFKERLGLIPMKTIIRTARERRPGALGYAEAMLLFYNKKCKYRLSMRKLYGTASDEDDLDDDDDSYTDE